MALRPAIAKKQKDEKLPLAIILIHFNFYLSGGVCAISILIGRLGIREATDTIYITSATPSRDLSWSPPTTVHDRWRRFRGCTPGMRGVPRDKLSGNGGIRYSFRCPERQAAGNGGILTLFVLPSGVWIALYLSSFLPKKLYCHSSGSARDDNDCCIYPGGESELAWMEILAVQSSRDNPLCIIDGAG